MSPATRQRPRLSGGTELAFIAASFESAGNNIPAAIALRCALGARTPKAYCPSLHPISWSGSRGRWWAAESTDGFLEN